MVIKSKKRGGAILSSGVWDAAEGYIKMGLPIITLCSPDHSNESPKHKEKCNNPGKVPILFGWREGKTLSINDVDACRTRRPKSNIGLVLGQMSGYIAIDADGEKGKELLVEISGGDLPPTWEYETPGGGYRYIYRSPKGVTMKKRIIPVEGMKHNAVELLGEGQQTVLPPSVHANGKRYMWTPGHNPESITEVPEAPKWMVDLMLKEGATKEKIKEVSNSKSDGNNCEILNTLSQKCNRFCDDLETQKDTGLDEDLWFQWVSTIVNSGQEKAAMEFSQLSQKHDNRSDYRVKLLDESAKIGMIRCETFGCSKENIRQCFGRLHFNKDSEVTNSPGAFIMRKEFEKIEDAIAAVQGAVEKMNGGDKSAYLDKFILRAFDFLESRDIAEYSKMTNKVQDAGGKAQELKRAVKNMKIEKAMNDTAYLQSIGFEIDPMTGQIKGINANKYSRYLLTRLDLIFTQGDRFYEYDGSVWKYVDDNELSRRLRDILHELVPDFWTISLEKQYIEALKREASKVGKMDSNKGHLNLKNGLLNLETLQIEEHRKEIFSTIQIPIVYDPLAKCSRFDRFLKEVFEDDDERINVIGEMMGYCLTAETKAQKAFLLYGKGANGKSKLLEVLIKLCGEDNTSSVPLRELQIPFARYDLVNKVLNVSTENEVSESGLNTQYFKSIVTGDPIRIDKKFEQSFTYSPICKLVFALNNLPFSKDRSSGFERRLLIIPFNRQFKGKKDDKNISEALGMELPGILNFAIEGLKRLRQNKYNFTVSKLIKEALKEYKEVLNPFYTFVEERIEAADEKDKVFYETIDKVFKEWCKENGHSRHANISRIKLAKEIKDVLQEKGIEFRVNKSEGKKCVWGVKLKVDNSISLDEVGDIEEME